jgi:hypothetical protein
MAAADMASCEGGIISTNSTANTDPYTDGDGFGYANSVGLSVSLANLSISQSFPDPGVWAQSIFDNDSMSWTGNTVDVSGNMTFTSSTLASGVVVGPDSNWTNSNVNMFGTGFLGTRWQVGSDYYYGWLGVAFADESDSYRVTFTNAAMNTTAGATILTPSQTPVPEIDPSTASSALSLAGGVLAMIEQRRRRAALVA